MTVLFITFILLSSTFAARADVAVLMLESTGTGMSRYTGAGHSAVYLSNVCQATPVKLRLCRPGEEGSVISTYGDFGETGSFDWNVTPLNLFLYGEEEVPIYGDPKLRQALQERYRQKYLGEMCPEETCGTGRGRWKDLVGATFTRDIYSFRVKTTAEQDEVLVNQFNAMPNVNEYNGFKRNCANFTVYVVNQYFPGAARADFWNDFDMTSPKAVAKSFADFGDTHPELGYSVERYTQVAGPIRRSLDNRNGTEVMFRAKKFSIPLLIVASPLLVYFTASYNLTARFNPEHEYETHRVGPGAEMTKKEEWQAWEGYKERFIVILGEAVRNRVFRRKKDVDDFFRLVAREGRTGLDAVGKPVLDMKGARVGLTRETLVQQHSDRMLAKRLMLARVNATLKAALKNRESLEEFREDWAVLAQLGLLNI